MKDTTPKLTALGSLTQLTLGCAGSGMDGATQGKRPNPRTGECK
jgi:hypothetical protein